ncbi:hypothetical protein IWQ51_001668 [Labrenzia sp. EL_142]|nr:hypothetical protein [Labrenzia sp. EL_142]
MANLRFSLGEILICATGLIVGAIAATGFTQTPDRTSQKPVQLESHCHKDGLRQQDMAIGRQYEQLALEVLQ